MEKKKLVNSGPPAIIQLFMSIDWSIYIVIPRKSPMAIAQNTL
jgi:hypothetical protein